MKDRRWIASLVLVLSLFLGLSMPVLAQEARLNGERERSLTGEESFSEAFDRGRQAYNSEDFEGARDAFIKAIQVAPDEEESYRNLARAYYWLGEYAAAVAFYDYYLRLNSEADDQAMIQQERRSALSRADGALWTLPSEQQMVRAAFIRELEEGRGLTAGGGGAFGLYQALLRAGYAAPEIGEYRQRLEQKIGAEFEANLAVRDNFLPLMRRQDWQMQAERLEALFELTRRPERLEDLERRLLVVKALQTLFDGNYAEGAQAASRAAAQNPDLPWMNWYHVLGLSRAGRPQQALQALQALLEQQKQASPQATARYEVLRAHILRQLDRDEEAAQIYRRLLLAPEP